VVTQEFRVSSPSSLTSRTKWIAGTYFFYQDNPNKQATRFGKDAAFLGVPDSLFSTINTTKSYRTGIAGFGQVTYALTEQLSLTAGLRYDFEHDKSDVLGQYQHDPDPNPQFDTRPDTSATANFSAVSPKAGLEYDFNAHAAGYITYSRGFRTGGFTQLSSDPSQPPLYAYKPEYSNNVEAGLKNTWLENRLRLNLAVFYSTIRQAQVPTLVLPDAVTITKNAGSMESYGGELELAATPASGFEIGYAFGYNHAVFQTLKISSNSTEADLSGKRQVFTPDLTSMLNVQYGFPLAKTKSGWPLKLVVRGEWQYLGTEYFDLANSIKQDGYSLLNAKIGIDAHAFQLSFWGRNLTGKKYIAYAYDFGAVHLGDPWNYGVSLVVRLRGKG
jgi:iron complex outermembrane receptor protein